MEYTVDFIFNTDAGHACLIIFGWLLGFITASILRNML